MKINQNIKDFFLLCSLVMIFVNSAQGRTRLYTTDNIEAINQTISTALAERVKANSLVIIPLDLLLAPDHPAFYVTNEKQQEIIKEAADKMSPSKRPYLDELILTNYPIKEINPKMKDLILDVQKLGVPIMVVTRNIAGSMDLIRYLEVWTWMKLYELGIDLSKSPIGDKQFQLDNGLQEVRGTYPTFFRGLLSCNSYQQRNSPQSVIATLLAQKLKWLPVHIYVIDENEKYVKALSAQFHSLKKDIEFEGFIYEEKPKEYAKISDQELKKFWQELVGKLNKIERVELESENKDPYK